MKTIRTGLTILIGQFQGTKIHLEALYLELVDMF